ncbi:cell envelope integrity protein TolA [Thermosulfidibacter takaii]|uniref:cell envelope integrity protein TolA n=1 Tax=Thermosulfidibacter takaii TaxID=412593 RepID=UPI00130EEB3D|nr:cell envelope integrity protein TolA [Thermosulfidibacter takaii]
MWFFYTVQGTAKVTIPLGVVYNVEIVPAQKLSATGSRRVRTSKVSRRTKIKKPVRVRKKSESVKPKMPKIKKVIKLKKNKNTVLISKKKAKVVKKRKANKVKPSKAVSEKQLLEQRLKELRAEKELEKKLEALRREKEREQSTEEEGSLVSAKGAGSEIAVSSASVKLDPVIYLYLSRLVSRIQLNWSLPEGITNKEAIVSVKIDRSGRLVHLALEKSSGDALFDESCLRAVRKSFPFDPLPSAYKGDYFEIGVRFKR